MTGIQRQCPFGAHLLLTVVLLVTRTLIFRCAPGWNRTSDTFFRREVLFP